MDYPRRITFNDNTMVRLMQLLDEVSTEDAYSWVDADRRTAARAATERGIECIIKCQIIIAGKPTVWCAQHDEVTYIPALACAYELPSLSGSESAGILRYLMSIPKPSPAIIQCVKDGVAWFISAKIEGIRIEKIKGDRQMIADATAPPLWARFYDLETGRPFVCDRDGVKSRCYQTSARSAATVMLGMALGAPHFSTSIQNGLTSDYDATLRVSYSCHHHSSTRKSPC